MNKQYKLIWEDNQTIAQTQQGEEDIVFCSTCACELKAKDYIGWQNKDILCDACLEHLQAQYEDIVLEDAMERYYEEKNGIGF